MIPYTIGLYLNKAHSDFLKRISEQLLVYHKEGTECNSTEFKDYDKEDEEMTKYFYEALGKRIVKEEEYDFIPSFGVSIPLDSPGYTFTILLSIMAIVFNLCMTAFT